MTYLSRDLENVSDPAIRAALADQVRDACVNVGFFYGRLSMFSDIDTSYLCTPASQEPRHLGADYPRRIIFHEGVLFIADRD